MTNRKELLREFLLMNLGTLLVSVGVYFFKFPNHFSMGGVSGLRPAELHSQSAEENCPTENVSTLRSVKGATLPCDACASIPCGLAVCKRFRQTVCRQQG